MQAIQFLSLWMIVISTASGEMIWPEGTPQVDIRSAKNSIKMGHTLAVEAEVSLEDGRPCSGYPVRMFVNGKRWGAEEVTDAKGQAEILLPLPNPGKTILQAMVREPRNIFHSNWIWSSHTADRQTLYFLKGFDLERKPDSAELRITCDDNFVVFLNGQQVGGGTNFQEVFHFTQLQSFLKEGTNVLAVKAYNHAGPAGLVARLDFQTEHHKGAIYTDKTWVVAEELPENWPLTLPRQGIMAHEIAPIGGGPWTGYQLSWPGLEDRSFPVGKLIPADAIRSNTLEIDVQRRPITRPPANPDKQVVMEWEPWFTPLNIRWDTANAVPLCGYYDSWNADVIRQHCIWMVEAGVDVLAVDFTNNLWDKQHWDERGPHVNELISATTKTLEEYAKLRKEGIPVPKMFLLLGLDNGPQTTTTAINEQMQWIHQHMVSPAEWRDLWVEYLGKPLIVILNGGGPKVFENQPPFDDSQFTIRFMASQHQFSKFNEIGYWSWMDGVPRPLPTLFNNTTEALTVTVAFFADRGWLHESAWPRRRGHTYVETFKAALEHQPRFLLINQWNEFAGQPDGSGYGPNKDIYVDCYNVPLSNDIEPTSLTACAYRGCGGYGFYYLNLTRALVDLYHQKTPVTTVMVIARPEPGATLPANEIDLEWNWIGKSPEGFRIMVDGEEYQQADANTTQAQLDLSEVKDGPHTLIIEALGTQSYYRLSHKQEDERLQTPIPAKVEVEFNVSEKTFIGWKTQ